MRHKRRGRVLGRSPSHRRALLRNLASALILTERETTEFDLNPPKVPGRITTTLAKAKEVRPMVEKCITLAKKAHRADLVAAEFATDAEPNSNQWRQWRASENYARWVEAMGPGVTARRRLFQTLRNKEAVEILCDDLAERFLDRPGGYTRIMRLATPRLGDNGTRAILEFVGVHDRVVTRSEKPQFDLDEDLDEDDVTETPEVVSKSNVEEVESNDQPSAEGGTDDAAAEEQADSGDASQSEKQ